MTALVPNLWTFLALTLVIGGAGAFVSGRAVALTWREMWKAVAYMVPFAAAVRFLHYALFQETTDAAQALLAFVVLAAFAIAGFFIARPPQMRRQYPWIANT